MSDRGSHVLGTYTHTVQFCWDWIGTPSNYSITSAKRTYSMKLWPDDKFCAHDPFSQWGRFSSGGNSLKKKSVKLWESTMGQNLVRNYFVRTYQDDHKCTYKYQGQLQWRPRVTIDLVLPHPKVRAPAVYPNR
ncbi:MAG: hypothetical protein HOV67_03795 [Kribbellaceae bacterium]|nr:hypothetical protein [Kribbellaceae bacterium]